MSIWGVVRHRRFWVKFAGESLGALGALAVAAGVIDIFAPGELAKVVWIVWPSLGVSTIWGIARAWPRPIQTKYDSPRTKIRVVEGDLFETKDHLVIGACDTFDTEPPHIAANSVQGQFLAREFGGNLTRLDAEISAALAVRKPRGRIAGKKGKDVRYPNGTVVVLESHARRYFLVAYTLMDKYSSASTTPDMLWEGLSELWRAVRRESNGTPLRMPIIGGGQSKASDFLPAEDALRFIALSFLMASRDEGKVCDELIIVARKDQYEALDHFALQSFLDRLRLS